MKMVFSSMLDAALFYASLGWPVFPCLPLSKAPAVSRGFHDASVAEDQIRKWWATWPKANVAIRTGATSGLYVVDVDAPLSPMTRRLPLTLIAKTRKGGWHHVYKLPKDFDSFPRNTTRKLADDTDTRGEGGYIVAAPSVVVESLDDPSGAVHRGVYEWDNDEDIADLPQWVIDEVKPQVAAVMPRASFAMGRPRWAEKALADETEGVSKTGEGSRNHRLNVAAFNLGQLVVAGHLSQGDVEAELTHAALLCGLKANEVQRTIRSGMSAGMKHPRGPRQELAVWKPDPFSGQEITISEVDLVEQIEAEPAGEDMDEKRWQLLGAVRELGGLCDSYCAWVVRGSMYPQPGLAIASLLALGSVLAGRRLVYSRMTSSLYCVALAPSGDGKGYPQRCLSRVLDEVWPALQGADGFSSGVAFTDEVQRVTNSGTGMCLIIDEYGMKLSGMLGPRAPAHRVDLKDSLTVLSTLGTGTWSPAKSKGSGGGRHQILAPCVTMLGSTTPESLHSVLTGTDVADGFVGRHVWFRAQDVLPQRQRFGPDADDSVPAAVRNAVSVIRARHEAWHMGLVSVTGSMDDLRLYDPIYIEATIEAQAVLEKFQDECDEAKRGNKNHEVPRAVIGRAGEMATRIAFILAVLAQPEREIPTICEMEAEVAIKLAKESMATFAESLAKNRRPKWDDPEGQVDLVLGVIRSKSKITKADLSRACRSLTPRTLEEVLERLEMEGTIARMAEKTGGRPKEVFALTSRSPKL